MHAKKDIHGTFRRAALGFAAASALFAASASAEEPQRFVLSGYTDAAGGAELLSGSYAESIEAASRSGYQRGTSGATTNLCVAYAATGRLDAALQACSRAVRAAKSEAASESSWAHAAAVREELARAYSNRAVVHWLAKNGAAAAGDLERASGLAPRAEFVAQNMAALRARAGSEVQVAEAKKR